MVSEVVLCRSGSFISVYNNVHLNFGNEYLLKSLFFILPENICNFNYDRNTLKELSTLKPCSSKFIQTHHYKFTCFNFTQ